MKRKIQSECTDRLVNRMTFSYLQFIRCMFCSDLRETLNITKSVFDECKESARKTVKAKINDALLRVVLKK